MAFDIHDSETERLVRALAEREGVSPAEAIRRAVDSALRRVDEKPSLWQRIQPIREAIASSPATGLEAEKAFYD